MVQTKSIKSQMVTPDNPTDLDFTVIYKSYKVV